LKEVAPDRFEGLGVPEVLVPVPVPVPVVEGDTDTGDVKLGVTEGVERLAEDNEEVRVPDVVDAAEAEEVVAPPMAKVPD